MAYKDNWLRHFFVMLTGGGRELSRDFWNRENIWDPTVPIRYRWLKLVWVQFASVLTQITLPLLALLALSSVIKGPPSVEFILLFVGGITTFGTLGLLVIEVASYICAVRRTVRSKAGGTKVFDSTTSSEGNRGSADHISQLAVENEADPEISEADKQWSEESPSTSLVVEPQVLKTELGNALLENQDGRPVLVIRTPKPPTQEGAP